MQWWDQLTVEQQRDVLECEPAINTFMQPEKPLFSGSVILSSVTSQQRETINKSSAYLNSLPPGKRQEIYRKLVDQTGYPDRPVFLAWAKTMNVGIQLVQESERRESALVTIPLELVRPAPGTSVTIPSSSPSGWSAIRRSSLRSAKRKTGSV